MRSSKTWRVLPVFLLLLALAMPALPAMAQDAGSVLSVDTPSDGQMNELGQDVVFIGWAAHEGGVGTGVDRVMVLDAPMAAGGVTVAEASYGLVRADVGAQYLPSWANSGFRAIWRASGATGNRTFWVYAHSTDNDGWTNKTVTIRQTEARMPAPAPAPAAVAPTQPVDPTDTQTGRYRNQSGLYGNTCDQYGTQYNNQSGNGQYNQYGSQYGYQSGYNQYGNQNNQYCNQNSTYGNSGQYGYGYGQSGSQYGQYNTQYPYDQYGYQNGQYYNSQYQCDQYGNPITYYNSYNQYNSQYPYNGTTTGYACSQNPMNGSTVVGTAGPDGSITVTWVPIASATQGYRIYQTSTNSLAAIVAQSYGSTASATVYGLTPNSSVTLQVRAVGSNSVETAIAASWSSSLGVGTIAPPLAVTVGTKTATTVVLTWTPSATGSITSYLVQQSVAGGAYTPAIVMNVTSTGALVMSLQPNTTYSFQVTAMASGVASTPSSTVSGTTLTV